MAQAHCETIPLISLSSLLLGAETRPADRLRPIIDKAVSEIFSIDAADLRAETRGRAPIALARQISMYLMHCSFSISLTEVGRVFQRDRTTVGHACKIIEDRRDEPSFDFMLNNLEEIVRRLCSISTSDRGF